jgi:outer membrane receptor protein involved in Fe transport
MRGLSAGGGTAATVGFYLDETPLSANAVALNGRTVIDPDLFDLNHIEVLRGPQGTLYGSGSMGGTIRLITNQPEVGKLDAATDLYVSDTSHARANGGGSLMVNIPIGEIAALRVVTTDKYVSGWIDRIVAQPGAFPAPTAPTGSAGAPANCGAYYCDRGDVAAAPIQSIIKGSNLERFASARAALLVKPSDELQQFPGTAGRTRHLPTLRPTGAVSRLLPSGEPQGRIQLSGREPDLGHQLLES